MPVTDDSHLPSLLLSTPLKNRNTRPDIYHFRGRSESGHFWMMIKSRMDRKIAINHPVPRQKTMPGSETRTVHAARGMPGMLIAAYCRRRRPHIAYPFVIHQSQHVQLNFHTNASQYALPVVIYRGGSQESLVCIRRQFITPIDQLNTWEKLAL